jgi:hypothetical protein
MRIAAFVAGMALLGLAGCYQVPQSTAASYEKGTIVASNQSAGGAVTVATVGMPSTGWVVLHAVKDGKPDTSGSIGHLYVPAGPSENVAVPLETAVKPGDQVVAMLHLDTGVTKVFEFANGGNEPHDLPVLKDGKPVMTTITLN